MGYALRGQVRSHCARHYDLSAPLGSVRRPLAPLLPVRALRRPEQVA
jgi:hypothetical protein